MNLRISDHSDSWYFPWEQRVPRTWNSRIFVLTGVATTYRHRFVSQSKSLHQPSSKDLYRIWVRMRSGFGSTSSKWEVWGFVNWLVTRWVDISNRQVAKICVGFGSGCDPGFGSASTKWKYDTSQCQSHQPLFILTAHHLLFGTRHFVLTSFLLWLVFFILCL